MKVAAMTLNLKAKIYNDETAARKHWSASSGPRPGLPSLRRHQRGHGASKANPPVPASTSADACQKPFSVTVGTVYRAQPKSR